MVQISKEDEFIVSCSQLALSQRLRQRVNELFGTGLNWKYIVQASHQHSVLPLVYHTLQKLNINTAACPALLELKKHTQAIVVRNLQMTALLIKLLTLFKKQKITAIPFKGPVLAEYVYGNLGLRRFGDLDILVAPQDIANAIQLLKSHNFKPNIILSPGQLAAYVKTEDDLVFQCQTSGIVVELHWELTGRYLPYPMDVNFLEPRLKLLPFLNQKIVHLSPEDLLLYLCVHGTRHMWERLEWVCGVAELIRNKPELQWKNVLSLARDLKCYRILQHGLFLTHTIFNVELPPYILEELSADPLSAELNKKIEKQLFPLFTPNQNMAAGNRFDSLQFQVQDSLGNKIRYGLKQLTEAREADWRWFPLPVHLTWLYVILRPLRLGIILIRQIFFNAIRNRNG